jgi:transcription initiation factor TFIID TATA-box-binding protein
MLEIVNIVATASLKQKVDLVEISKMKHIIFDQEIYGGRVAYLKTPSMHGKVTIFSSGKLISVGTKSPTEAREDLQATAEMLSEHNYIKQVEIEAQVRNIVAVKKLSERLDLEEIANRHPSIYEPEQFPALIMKLNNPKATLLIFSTGKIVIAGTKSQYELEETEKHIKKILAP